MNHTYETIFICPGDISQEKVELTLEKVKGVIQKTDGKIITSELWGRRRLAYPVEKQRDGFYVYLLFSASAKAPSALEHHYRVTDTTLRGLTVKVDPRYVDKVRVAVRTVSSDGVSTPETNATSTASTAQDVASSGATASPVAETKAN